VGRLGKGKTLSGVLWVYGCFCAGIKVYSNIWLGFPHIPIKTPYDFIDMHDGVALLDELWSLADSRKRRLLGDIVTIICLRSRKKDFSIFYTQQFLQIDIRIRYITDYWIKPQTFPDHVTGFPPQYLKQVVFNGDFQRLPDRTISDVSPYLNLYDTKQDPYTLASSLEDSKLREALDIALAKDPEMIKELETIQVKARMKARKLREKTRDL
jgi:hypothetical protein